MSISLAAIGAAMTFLAPETWAGLALLATGIALEAIGIALRQRDSS